MDNFNFKNWTEANCLELVSLIKEVIEWEDPQDIADELLEIAMDLKAKGRPEAETYKKAYEAAIQSIYEGASDPFKNALESKNQTEVVTKSLYMIVDKYCQKGREGLKNNEKNYSAESYFLAAFIQTEIIRRAFNILSLDTFYLYKTTIQSKIHPIGFPDSHEKIKSLIENVITNKKIQIGVIDPLSFFLGGLIYVGEPNPKLIVNWIDNNVGEVLMNLINGKIDEAIKLCEIYKEQDEKEIVQDKKVEKISPKDSSSSFRPFAKTTSILRDILFKPENESDRIPPEKISNEKESQSFRSFKTNLKLKSDVENKASSWSKFYSEFKGKFTSNSSLLIEFSDTDESRMHLKSLGYKKSNSRNVDVTRLGEYFPTILVDEDLTIVIFHKLPSDFNFKKSKVFVKKWFGLNTKFINHIDICYPKEIPDLYTIQFTNEQREIAQKFISKFENENDELPNKFAKSFLKIGLKEFFHDKDIVNLIREEFNIKDYLLYKVDDLWKHREDDELREYFNSDIKLLEKSINWVEIIKIWVLLLNELGYERSQDPDDIKENPKIKYESKDSNIYNDNNDDVKTHKSRIDQLLHVFWECTPFINKEKEPFIMSSENDDKTINFSYSNGLKTSCFYTIQHNGEVTVKDTNEILNLNDFSHLIAIIAAVIKDIYGEYDQLKVGKKFVSEVQKRGSL
tara:strand:+ start:210 stop:2255 length:2046 start_codon:yes stop_codon:yes gene_type:complete